MKVREQERDGEQEQREVHVEIILRKEEIRKIIRIIK